MEYDTGEVVYSALSGASEEVQVYLEQDAVEVDPTYASTSSVTRFRVINKSDHKVSLNEMCRNT